MNKPSTQPTPSPARPQPEVRKPALPKPTGGTGFVELPERRVGYQTDPKKTVGR